jgi:2-polyprenyl-6-methoxyphenol hydroxylase-like FAD-dependent oxidoreductase
MSEIKSDFSVIIIGAGPIGMNLALDLAFRKIRCLIIEKNFTTSQHPQGNTHNLRTMEHYRKLGLADKIRNVGLPLDHSGDAVFVTRINSHELCRINIPTLRERSEHGSNDLEIGPETFQRASQMFVEKILKEEIDRSKYIDVRFGWVMEEFSQSNKRVTMDLRHLKNDKIERLTCDYMVGCDGAQGKIRKILGIKYTGKSGDEVDFMMGRMLSIYFESPDLYKIMKIDPPWQFHSMNSDGRVSIVALDGRGKFLTWAKLGRDDDPNKVDPVSYIYQAIGEEVPVKVISALPWQAGLSLVAEKYQVGRILLAGDAAHLFTPTGGFGMNTGIGDVDNLGWKLAAVCEGWGTDSLIKTYETERQQVAIRNLAQSYALAEAKSSLSVPNGIERSDNEGEKIRLELAKSILKKLKEEYFCVGIQLGARYDHSPIIVDEGNQFPNNSPYDYTPTSQPGGRAPHAWLKDGSALFDHFSNGFTLLKLGSVRINTDNFINSAIKLGIPIALYENTSKDLLDLYKYNLILVRPDQYVAWRGDKVPEDLNSVLKLVSGRDLRH